MKLLGVDFTSAPSRRKPITVAHGRLEAGTLVCEALARHEAWLSFEQLLRAPGPWLGAFDFPFGLPRDGVSKLGWPDHWPELVAHCAALGKQAFKSALDADRTERPYGARYPHRATDIPARSHSPFKLVNPPVGMMFLEGAPRLLAAGVTIPGMCQADPLRIAVEAYPALVARKVSGASYKSDERTKQTPERERVRCEIVAALSGGQLTPGLTVRLPDKLKVEACSDGSGDLLDALLALTQAAAAWSARADNYGLPRNFDPVEGWIVGSSDALKEK
ncbi:DUF429 domain-containing protein [Niveibacterium sp.]|uniref:DUF429 domain-containing protein n=1 Tax=Niveibacterium sp. TaxID=2017444 RepID=UPI0035B3DAE4